MTRLFGREARLIVGDLDVSQFRFGFTIEKHLRKEPNTAKITIYNLSERHRRSLEGRKKIPVQLEAGYAGDTFLLFLGLLDATASTKNGPDWVTNVWSDDGKKGRKARGPKSYRSGIDMKRVMQDMTAEMGVGVGNLLEVIGNKLNVPGLGSAFGKGLTTKGKPSETLFRVLKDAGIDASIQDGEISARRVGKAIGGTAQAVFLRRDTGLVDVPAVDRKGRLEARSLLRNGLTPGRAVKVESVTANGVWLIDAVTYTGDTYGPDWYAEIEGPPLS